MQTKASLFNKFFFFGDLRRTKRNEKERKIVLLALIKKGISFRFQHENVCALRCFFSHFSPCCHILVALLKSNEEDQLSTKVKCKVLRRLTRKKKTRQLSFWGADESHLAAHFSRAIAFQCYGKQRESLLNSENKKKTTRIVCAQRNRM